MRLVSFLGQKNTSLKRDTSDILLSGFESHSAAVQAVLKFRTPITPTAVTLTVRRHYRPTCTVRGML